VIQRRIYYTMTKRKRTNTNPQNTAPISKDGATRIPRNYVGGAPEGLDKIDDRHQ
jgi:hypothetical protein